MGFWDVKLGAPAQEPGPTVTTAPATQQGPWWAQGALAQQPAILTVQHPQEQPATPQETGTWGTVEGSTRKAKSARLDERCPDCGSTNYFKPDGMPNAITQCYECGSNSRFSQSTQGAGLPGGEAAGPATPARQVGEGGGRGGISNFHPEIIVGKA